MGMGRLGAGAVGGAEGEGGMDAVEEGADIEGEKPGATGLGVGDAPDGDA